MTVIDGYPNQDVSRQAMNKHRQTAASDNTTKELTSIRNVLASLDQKITEAASKPTTFLRTPPRLANRTRRRIE
jgi:hypothetical protein